MIEEEVIQPSPAEKNRKEKKKKKKKKKEKKEKKKESEEISDEILSQNVSISDKERSKSKKRKKSRMTESTSGRDQDDAETVTPKSKENRHDEKEYVPSEQIVKGGGTTPSVSEGPARKKAKENSTPRAGGKEERKSETKKSVENEKKTAKPLNGLTLAVSTLDTGEKHSSANSYKSVAADCVAAGASVTGQVHKRVFAVICNPSAVTQATQRVRKALKKNILLLDVRWLRECLAAGRRLDHDAYLLNELAGNAVKHIKTDGGKGGDNDLLEASEIDPNAGWSEPVNLDCCCLCHENGDLNCPWCVSCNINVALSKKG